MQAKNQFKQYKEREAKIFEIVHNLCQYSTTSRFEALSKRESSYYTGTSQDQQSLEQNFEELDIADLVSVQIQDFINLLEICQIKLEKQRQLDAEMTIQRMITLNQRNLLDDSQLVSFFRTLEAIDISQYFQTADIILKRYNRPRLIACFKQIARFQRQIKLGIVHEIYVNIDHLEEYAGYIQNICSERIKAYTTHYQAIFFSESGIFGRNKNT